MKLNFRVANPSFLHGNISTYFDDKDFIGIRAYPVIVKIHKIIQNYPTY